MAESWNKTPDLRKRSKAKDADLCSERMGLFQNSNANNKTAPIGNCHSCVLASVRVRENSKQVVYLLSDDHRTFLFRYIDDSVEAKDSSHSWKHLMPSYNVLYRQVNILANMARHQTSTAPSMISLLTAFSTVLGCGVIPAGQVSTRTFTVTGLTTLPVAMVYTMKPENSARIPGIATSEAQAKGFVERLVMQTVLDVLENQGRSALLPDALISTILGQLTINVTYQPMQCQIIIDSPMAAMPEVDPAMPQNCIIVDNTVTGICNVKMKQRMCTNNNKVEAIPASHTSVSGTLTTTNMIMANWSRSMWQNVLNRAVRMLASGSFGSHLFSATVTVGGN
ncbi:hypothetical protein KIN20_002666 [Parelaphostrongylus tenuis]|uniref:Uncharacterized protein n=1 Tax=Parelaphostrongylus tenuis TaxID=148309 RepID=A0AAD5LYW2_PARTN|nr:hypothetical protein KIN20_002666 [Parelaphostrongylus tenuis]